MDERINTQGEKRIIDHLKGRVSRAQLLKAAGAGIALAALPRAASADNGVPTVTYPGNGQPPTFQYPYYPQVQGRYTPEGVFDILNVLITGAYLRVTLASNNARLAPTIGITGVNLAVLQADIALEQAHIDFLSSLGATPLTTTFTAPPPPRNDPGALLAVVESRQTVQVAMYMAAVREFAELGQPTLAKWAFQAGAVEAEDRGILRVLQAVLSNNPAAIPPNNKAYETDLLLYVRDAVTVWKALGLIGGSGTALAYPGRAAALALASPMANAVIQRTPNNATSTIMFVDAASLNAERT